MRGCRTILAVLSTAIVTACGSDIRPSFLGITATTSFVAADSILKASGFHQDSNRSGQYSGNFPGYNWSTLVELYPHDLGSLHGLAVYINNSDLSIKAQLRHLLSTQYGPPADSSLNIPNEEVSIWLWSNDCFHSSNSCVLLTADHEGATNESATISFLWPNSPQEARDALNKVMHPETSNPF